MCLSCHRTRRLSGHRGEIWLEGDNVNPAGDKTVVFKRDLCILIRGRFNFGSSSKQKPVRLFFFFKFKSCQKVTFSPNMDDKFIIKILLELFQCALLFIFVGSAPTQRQGSPNYSHGWLRYAAMLNQTLSRSKATSVCLTSTDDFSQNSCAILCPNTSQRQ